jgi:ABC-type Zn uptake system ZnuABC Zn-binding protein ZnuA
MSLYGGIMARLRILLAAVTLAVVMGCAAHSPWDKSKSPHILVSFSPLYCFAANVDPQADVQVIMSKGDPHARREPTMQDAMLLRDANVFFVNGLGLDENFATTARRSSGTPNLEIIELGERIPQDSVIKVKDEPDPHVWLGIPEAIGMVEGIRDELKKKHPMRASDYDKSAGTYISRLKKLHEEGKQTFAAIPADRRKIISFHDSLQYFARSFDIKVVDVLRKIPEQEPTPQDIANVAKICKEQHVRVIVAEPEYGDGPAQELKRQLRQQGVADVEIVKINPLETPPEGAELTPSYYEDAMRENIANLAKALR